MSSIVRAGLAGGVDFRRPVTRRGANFPSKQIDLIVPFVAGGTTDSVVAPDRAAHERQLGPACDRSQPAGRGSTIGTNIVAKAAADGHTLLVTTIAFAINASLQKTPYDPIKDFAPITELSLNPDHAGGSPVAPVKSVKELIEYSKAQPAGLDYASSGAAPRRIWRPRCSTP